MGNYTAREFVPPHRRPINFPKSVLTNQKSEIREFDDPDKQLYYYLNWSSKMVMKDQGFIHFEFRSARDIGVFNTELHDKRSNAVLYAVANMHPDAEENALDTKLCKPIWIMDELLTARQLFSIYGIQQRDLPQGSRALHNCFESEINSHYAQLQQLMPVTNWNKIPMLVGAQKSIKREEALKKKKTFINLECLQHTDLNAAIRDSVDQIKRDELELIPILNINGRVYCDALIPIRVGSKWFAVQYKTATVSPYRATVTGLCVDAEDILNKASLVDPNAVTTYKWILGGDRTVTDSKPCPMKSGASVSKMLHEQNIDGLNAQLNAARQREEMLSRLVVTQMQLRQSIAMPTAVNRVQPLYQTASAAPISPIRVSAQVYSPVSNIPMSSFPQISTIGNGSISL